MDTPLSTFRVRPRFRVCVAAEPEVVRSRVLDALGNLPEGMVLRSFPGLVGLHIAEERRRSWSPRLLLNFEPQRDGTTIIEGIYGPETEIWSVFLYGYIFAGMIGVFSAILGGAQFFIGHAPWAFWVTGSMAILACGLYVAAQLGQKLGVWQTFQLHQVWQSVEKRMALPPACD